MLFEAHSGALAPDEEGETPRRQELHDVPVGAVPVSLDTVPESTMTTEHRSEELPERLLTSYYRRGSLWYELATRRQRCRG